MSKYKKIILIVIAAVSIFATAVSTLVHRIEAIQSGVEVTPLQ